MITTTQISKDIYRQFGGKRTARALKVVGLKVHHGVNFILMRIPRIGKTGVNAIRISRVSVRGGDRYTITFYALPKGARITHGDNFADCSVLTIDNLMSGGTALHNAKCYLGYRKRCVARRHGVKISAVENGGTK